MSNSERKGISVESELIDKVSDLELGYNALKRAIDSDISPEIKLRLLQYQSGLIWRHLPESVLEIDLGDYKLIRSGEEIAGIKPEEAAYWNCDDLDAYATKVAIQAGVNWKKVFTE